MGRQRDRSKGVVYLEPWQAKFFKVTRGDQGRFYFAEGDRAILLARDRRIQYLAVIAQIEDEPEIYAVEEDLEWSGGILKHSSFSGTKPVFAAMEIIIENGKLLEITNSSGHYLPSILHIMLTIEFMKDLMFDVSHSVVKIRVHKQGSVYEFPGVEFFEDFMNHLSLAELELFSNPPLGPEQRNELEDKIKSYLY